MSAEAVRVVEQIQDALGTGDVVAALADATTEQAVRQVFGELAEADFQVVMRGPAYLPAAFEGKGVDGFRGAWSEWTSAFESYRIDVERVIDAGDLVVSLVTMAGRTRTGGVEIEAPGAAVWTVVDGRLRRVEFHLDRDEALRTAGLEP
jgi:ketosteroid isomerase-like protein